MLSTMALLLIATIVLFYFVYGRVIDRQVLKEAILVSPEVYIDQNNLMVTRLPDGDRRKLRPWHDTFTSTSGQVICQASLFTYTRFTGKQLRRNYTQFIDLFVKSPYSEFHKRFRRLCRPENEAIRIQVLEDMMKMCQLVLAEDEVRTEYRNTLQTKRKVLDNLLDESPEIQNTILRSRILVGEAFELVFEIIVPLAYVF